MVRFIKKWILVLKIIKNIIFNPSKPYLSIVEEICKKEIERQPDNIVPIWLLASSYERYQRYEEALVCLERLGEKDFNNKSILFLNAKVYFNLGKYEKVEELLSNTSILSERDCENYYLGCSFFEQQKYNEAIIFLNNYVKHYNKNYIPFVKLGYSYYQLKNYDLALQSYRKAEKLNPSEKEIKKSISLCHEKLI